MADPRTLTTDRLVMTPHGLADFPDIMQMWSDPAVVPFLGGAPFNEEDSWARLLRYTGTEAVRAALGWGATHFHGRNDRTVAMIHPDNSASVAVAERCGFRHFAVARYKDQPTSLWACHWPS
jgi:RimJ/RimL family protein N-acetyltransferase